MFILKPTEDTKALFIVVKRHPIALGLIYLPAVAGVVGGSVIYHFIPSFLFPLLVGIMLSMYLTNGYFSGQIGDNWGTATRKAMPFQYWRKMAFWICAYMFIIAWTIGYAMQEKTKTISEPIAATLLPRFKNP